MHTLTIQPYFKHFLAVLAKTCIKEHVLSNSVVFLWFTGLHCLLIIYNAAHCKYCAGVSYQGNQLAGFLLKGISVVVSDHVFQKTFPIQIQTSSSHFYTPPLLKCTLLLEMRIWRPTVSWYEESHYKRQWPLWSWMSSSSYGVGLLSLGWETASKSEWISVWGQ